MSAFAVCKAKTADESALLQKQVKIKNTSEFCVEQNDTNVYFFICSPF